MSNLLTVVFDDLPNPWRLGTRYGVPMHTPNLDAFMGTSTYFSNAVCTVPVCGPSRWTWITGMTPAQSGASAFMDQRFLKNRATDTIYHHLRRAGFHVISGGKVVDGRTAAAGWQGQIDSFMGQQNTSADAPGTAINTSIANVKAMTNESDMGDTRVINFCIEQLAAAPAGRPLALFTGLFSPHEPYYAPQWCFDLYDPADFQIPADFTLMDASNVPDFIRRFELRRETAPGGSGDWRTDETAWRNAVWGNFALTTWADYLFGQILAAWNASPYAADGAVSIISDHGFHLGDYWTWFKYTTLSPAVGLPMIWKAPGQTQARVKSKPVGLLDHFQTMCDFAGISVPRPIGKSLKRMVLNQADNTEHYAVSHVFGSVTALLEANTNGNYQNGGTIYRITEHVDGSVGVYANETDWQNITNIATENTTRTNNLRARLRNLASQGGFGYPDTPVGMKRRASVAELRQTAQRTALKLTGGDEQVFTYNSLQDNSDLGEGYDLLWFLGDQGGTILMPKGAESAALGSAAAHGDATTANINYIANIMANDLDNLIDAGHPSIGDIYGFAGNDTIIGGTRQYGGAGNDRIEGYRLADQMYGGPGNDTLIGGGGTDLLDGGDGNDSIVGNTAKDTIYGGAGNDTIIADAGADWIDGGPGDDRIDAGPAADTVIASGGYDDIDLGVGANDTLIVKRIEATTTVRNFNTGDIFDLSDWSVLGPVTVTAQGADVLVRSGMETIVVKSASVNNVKAAITGATVAP